jgi:hypothetical protein
MQSARQLRNAFLRFNRRYWNGELPEHTVLYWEPLPADKDDASTCPVYEVDHGQFKIILDPLYKSCGTHWKINLLHEMIHLALWVKHPKHAHGKLFKEEQKRIYLMGAYQGLL